MNVVLFSDDHHSNNDPYDLKIFKELAVRTALEAVVKNDFGIHAGDMFHYRHGDSETLDWITGIYAEVLGKRIADIFFLVANHDGNNREITPIAAFANGAKCYGRGPTIVGSEPIARDSVVMRGWLSNQPFGLSQQYLVSHARVKEWVFNNPEKSFCKTELESIGFKRIFLGDCHQRKDEGKLVSIGSLCPKDFGDKDVQAGFIIFDTDHNDYRRIDIPDYPIFREIKIYENVEFEPNPEYIKGNIIRLEFIGSHKFVHDKDIKQRWLSRIWCMEPHYVAEPKFEQTTGELPEIQNEISVEEEIKQAAQMEPAWPEGAEKVAIEELTK